MKSRDFCFWLQGYFELQVDGDKLSHGISAAQVQIIQRHLNLVFTHDIDPSMPDPTGKLQAIHDGAPIPKPTPSQGDELVRC